MLRSELPQLYWERVDVSDETQIRNWRSALEEATDISYDRIETVTATARQWGSGEFSLWP